MSGNVKLLLELGHFAIFFRLPKYYDISRDEILPGAFRMAWKGRKLFGLGEAKTV